MGPEYIALASALIGTGAQMYSANEQKKDQRRILNRQLTETGKASDQAAQQVIAEAQKMAPEARAEAMQQQESAAYQQAQKDLQTGAGGGAVIDGAGDAGAVSADFIKAKADRAASEGNRLTSIARELAKSRAPGMLLGEEGIDRANLAGNLQNLWSSTRNMSGASSLDAQSVGQPLIGALGQAVSAYGMSQLASPRATTSATGGTGISAGGSATGVQLGNNAGTSMWSKNGSRIKFGGA